MKKNHTKEVANRKIKKSNWIKNCIRNIVLLNPFWLTAFIIVLLFLFAFIFCWISVDIDLGKWVDCKKFLTYLYFEWSIEDGLSLLIGYLGMGATIVLGLIALRFSFKTEERNRIERLQNIVIKRICLYDMFDDFVPSKLRYDDVKKCRFLLELELSGENSSYEIQIEKVWWANCNDNYESDGSKELNQCKTYVENAKNVVIYVYFDEFEDINDTKIEENEKKNSISYFYHIWDYEPLLLERNVRHRWIQLDMHICEKVWNKRKKPNEFMAEVEILVENRCGTKKKKDWVDLQEIRHNIKIDNT